METAMVINTNLPALRSSRLLGESNRMLTRSLARLASGSKITSPEDDPAGLAVAAKLNSDNLSHRAALSNMENVLSFSLTQDGLLQKAQKAMNRMSELAVLAQDATKTDADRQNYDQEYQALKGQLDKAFRQEFNGIRLFGSGSGVVTNLNQVGSGLSSFTIDTGGLTGTVEINFNFFGDPDRIKVYYPPIGDGGTLVADSGLVSGAGSISADFGPGGSTQIEIIVNEDDPASLSAWTFTGTITAEAGGLKQVTTDGKGNKFALPIISGVAVSGSVTTASNAASALTSMKSSIQTLANRRARVGSTIARLQAHIEELQILRENTEQARSRITDTNVALETARFARHNIVTQAATAMLAQANLHPQTSLRLLNF